MEQISRKKNLGYRLEGDERSTVTGKTSGGIYDFTINKKDMSMTRSRDDRDGVFRESAEASFLNPDVRSDMFRVPSAMS